MVKTGAAFGDYIRTGGFNRSEGGNLFTRKEAGMRDLLSIFLLIIFLIVFLIKLFFLQIIQGRYYRGLSDINRIKKIAIHSSRGIIFDRNGVPLVFNIPGFRQKQSNKINFISYKKALGIIAKGENNLEIDAMRQYPYKEILSHVIGYIGQISREELDSDEFKSGYKLGDIIGKTGIEKQYENILVGIDGKQLVEIDNDGAIIRKLGQSDPVSGQNITLSIDIKLQQVVFDAMKDVEKGAAIVMAPRGEVLALVSKPTFDSNLFTMGEDYDHASDSVYSSVSEILEDNNNQPLLNRAIGGIYPPGSTYKLITAAVGLEKKIIDKDFEVIDNGFITLGNFSFANWYYLEHGEKEGSINIERAISRSNDIFFYKLAELIGVERLSEMSRKFGLGQKLGIDIPGEASGVVPDDAWKKKIIGEQWYLGDTYHYGIGQGYLLTTPLQVNLFTQAIANKGIYYKPHIIKTEKPEQLSEGFLSNKTIEIIRNGMIGSCNTGGVAWPLFDFKVKNPKLKIDGKNIMEAVDSSASADIKDYRHISIACKTGTAQHGDDKTKPHAWITLFAPAYNPQIFITVLAESGGQGSSIASPVAKKILENWFTR
ncbi:MAG: hypothetical protein EXS44_03130 [Candidatus Levybacteria bacterium]|nr:hypothetical protein [Candidatus Levybacteria bacterium]